MAELQNTYTQARRLVMQVREGLGRLEGSEAPGGAWGPAGAGAPDLRRTATSGAAAAHHSGMDALSRATRAQLEELGRLSAELDRSWRQSVVGEAAARRDVWKRKVEQVAEDLGSLRMALDGYSGRQGRRQLEEEERRQLLQRVDVHGVADRARHDFDVEGQMQSSVANSKRVLAEALGTGAAVLESMGATKERLKGAQRKALDVLHTLGLSDSVLRMVERRHARDALLIYGGMLLVVALCLWLLWRKLLGK